MGIGTSIFLIAVGAILKFAVTAEVSGLELSTVGVILMVCGALGLVLSLFMFNGARRATVVDRPVVRDREPLLGTSGCAGRLGRGLGRRRRAGVDDLLHPPPLGDLAVVQDERDADQLAGRLAVACSGRSDLAERADHEAVAGLHVRAAGRRSPARR